MIAKTKEELEILREGGRRLASHVRKLSEMTVPGITSAELEKAAREMVAKDGDLLAFYGYKTKRDTHGYPSGLCVSVNDVIVHSPAAENGVVIKEGDVVCLDFGIKHRGLFTDHAATLIAGKKHDPEDEKLVKGTYEDSGSEGREYDRRYRMGR